MVGIDLTTEVLMFNSPDRRFSDSVKWGLYDQDVLPLWVADMDFTSPPAVMEALHGRVDHGVFGYALESEALKEQIVARMDALYQWKIAVNDVVLLPGVVSAFNLVCQATTNPGESILLQPPVYPPFFRAPHYAGARPVFNVIDRDSSGAYKVDLEAFDKAIQPDTHCFLLCNPHNPLGRVFTREELIGMAESCLRHDLIICSDEIHSDLIYEGYHHIPIASLSKEIEASTVTLIAPSKTYNIAGLECSALICPNQELRKKINHTRRGLLGGVNLMGMVAGRAAYQHGEAWLKEILNVLQGNRDLLMEYLAHELPVIKMVKPEATYLAWLDCRELDLAEAPFKFFLGEARVALNNGEEFGEPGKGFVRLNFGCTPELLLEALGRMKQSLNR